LFLPEIVLDNLLGSTTNELINLGSTLGVRVRYPGKRFLNGRGEVRRWNVKGLLLNVLLNYGNSRNGFISLKW